jgi:uncharacterized protein (DUF433 family)
MRRPMTKATYTDRIVRDPTVCGGEPVIRGTRVRIKVILDNLAEGQSNQTILRSYPSLTNDDIQAVIAFAAASLADDFCHPVPEVLTA